MIRAMDSLIFFYNILTLKIWWFYVYVILLVPNIALPFF